MFKFKSSLHLQGKLFILAVFTFIIIITDKLLHVEEPYHFASSC